MSVSVKVTKKHIAGGTPALPGILLLLFLLIPVTAHGQYLRLMGDSTRTALYFDVDKLWNYNLYEYSRWGGGLRLVTHPERFVFSRIDAEAYLGYGIRDEQWKYGVALAEHVRGSRNNSVFYQRALKDYFAAANRYIGNPWNNGGQLLGGFMARRMTEEHSITLGYRMNLDRWRWAVEITLGERGWLFDENHPLYANEAPIEFERLGRLRVLLSNGDGLNVMVDYFSDWQSTRLLANYRHSIPLSVFQLDIYTQGGLTPACNEYIDMFDLGGTWGAPLYLSNNLLTARPNEFTANTFALLSLRLQTTKPLFSVYSPLFSVGSNPVPFIGMKAVWGMMWGQDSDGQRPWLTSYLQAPHEGLFEPSLGVDGLVRWGAVDWGLAVAYRLAPASAPYHYSNTFNNLTLLITAKLINNTMTHPIH